MKVCITEKPSVARDIAGILGATTRRNGYFEGKDVCVTWTYGHLCTLKEPHEYNEMWKRWALSCLPMIPDRFGIKLINQKSIKEQFKVIKTLVGTASEVINCGDAGQEGELIQRWVLQKAGAKCPVRRLWISSLTDEAIREGFRNLKDESVFNNLYFAGLSRAIGDWVLGLNATRLYSLKYGRPGIVLSIGRVQTPTLALIVNRQLEIENFRPEKYWELITEYRGAQFKTIKGKFSSEDDARKVLGQVAVKEFTITNLETKAGKEYPPKLFDLTSLQVECNKLWGWSAEQTLKLIQTLYEKKVTTYPRVDTTYLSEDLYPKIPGILRKMTPYAPQTAPVLSKNIVKSKRIFDNAKVTDHHAIIPTGESPRILEGDEKKLYHIIALRFIAAFYPECTFLTTTVNGESDSVAFKTTGKQIKTEGWKVLYKKQEDSDKGEENVLPEFVIGEKGPHNPSIAERETQPPKYYTEGTLLRAMESAGNMVEDDDLREALKVNGIGRPSTRAAIIETLFKRKYIERRKKTIIATPAGIELIATIKEELLKSAKLTGLWENKLRRIESGDYSAKEFLDEIKQMITQIVNDVLADNSMHKIEVSQELKGNKKSGAKKSAKIGTTKPRAKRMTMKDVKCPKCGSGHMIKGNRAFGCSRYKEGCNYVIPFTACPATTTPTKLAKFIKDH